MRRLIWAALCACVACGGSVAGGDDAGADVSPTPTAPACFQTEWGCSFCVDGAEAGACGNIGRVVDGGAIEYGCCVGATPYCRAGECVRAAP